MFRMLGVRDLSYFIRGILMGGADIIPGVSGGTVALIVGIYARLVRAISRIDKKLVEHLLRREWLAIVERIDLKFLLVLGTGIVTGILGLASLMHYLLEQHTQYTLAAFFGLILASSILVGKLIPKWTPGLALVLLSGAVFAYGLFGLPLLQNPPSGYAYVFLSGAIAICAMILPGISGSFILLALGMYHEMTGLIRNMLRGDIGVDGVLTIVVFSFGCAIGLISFSKLITWLLGSYYKLTMAVICGVMIGSLRRIWPFRIDMSPEITDIGKKHYVETWPSQFSGDVLFSIAIAAFAFALVFALDRLAKRTMQKSA